jgi:hypothetical protein
MLAGPSWLSEAVFKVAEAWITEFNKGLEKGLKQ